MEKICPLMSKPVSISHNDVPLIRIPEMQYIDCLKEKCELWIKKKTEAHYSGEDIDIEGCSKRLLAEK